MDEYEAKRAIRARIAAQDHAHAAAAKRTREEAWSRRKTLLDDIRCLALDVLQDVEATGFPKGRIISVRNPEERRKKRAFQDRAAWLIVSVKGTAYKGEGGPTMIEFFLLADGSVSVWSEILTSESSIDDHYIELCLEGLRAFGSE